MCFCFRCSSSKPTRGRVNMMPIGTPRVPYRVPGEGTWQWVDLWNALVSLYNISQFPYRGFVPGDKYSTMLLPCVYRSLVTWMVQ